MVENISRCSDLRKLRIVQVSDVLPGHPVYHFCVSAKPWFESGIAFLAATGRRLLPDSRELPDRHSRAGAVGLAQGQSRRGPRLGDVPAGTACDPHRPRAGKSSPPGVGRPRSPVGSRSVAGSSQCRAPWEKSRLSCPEGGGSPTITSAPSWAKFPPAFQQSPATTWSFASGRG